MSKEDVADMSLLEVNDMAIRIQRAVEGAGFDPRILNQLPPGYIAAALILGVK